MPDGDGVDWETRYWELFQAASTLDGQELQDWLAEHHA